MNVKVFMRTSFVFYPYFALCLDCWGVGKPARTMKKAKQQASCTCPTSQT